jgi:hypothetical protein
MGALVLCGVPAEKYWPYKVEDNLALDFWSLPGMDWVDSKQFGI